MYFNQKSILAADYLRLSREDGDKLESDSIRNQRSLINDFVKQHKEIQLVEEYIDDGYSGTNFDRPAFQRMLEDVKRKKINCIIVKDLSRLGRNYIETGRYLEKIFPFMGVRFIAITDHYDSATGSDDADQIIVPFKNLINDACFLMFYLLIPFLNILINNINEIQHRFLMGILFFYIYF